MYNCIFWYFIACACNMDGSKDVFCNDKGKCSCKDNYHGIKCDQCKQGYSGPMCLEAGNFLHY